MIRLRAEAVPNSLMRNFEPMANSFNKEERVAFDDVFEGFAGRPGHLQAVPEVQPRRCDCRAHRKHHLAPAALHRAVVHWHRPVLELRPQLHAALGPGDPRLFALGPADPLGNRASRSASEQAPWSAAMQRLASDINVDCSNLAALTGTVFVKRSALLPASTTLRRSTTPSTATACR
jgi:hypothetical protein